MRIGGRTTYSTGSFKLQMFTARNIVVLEAEIYTALDMLPLSRTLLKAQQFHTVEAETSERIKCMEIFLWLLLSLNTKSFGLNIKMFSLDLILLLQ